MRQKLAVVFGVICMMLVVPLVGVAINTPTRPALPAAGPGPEFRMVKVPAQAVNDNKRQLRLLTGQRTWCTTQPAKEVKAYPKLMSDHPYYGHATLEKGYSSNQPGFKLHYVLDESKGTGRGHDRLYIDRNRDLDLTNDGVLKALRRTPPGDFPDWEGRQRVFYERFSVEFDNGPGLGRQPFEILPWFLEGKDRKYAFAFFVPTEARIGRIWIGSKQYDALLCQPYCISGRYDRPFTTLYLTPAGLTVMYTGFFGQERLGWLHWVNGRHWSVSASPLGDTLTVRPYKGDYGVFEVGPGGRDIEKMAASGFLLSETSGAGVGKLGSAWPEKAQRCEVPVGDYLPSYLRFDYGRLEITISNCYYGEANQRRGIDDPVVFGIHIRKDKPYVFDFANKPNILFVNPEKDARVKPGDKVDVRGLLVDPVLDIMFRGLREMERQEPPRKGRNYTQPGLSLEPQVRIANARGEKVAEGKMPFG